MSFPEWTFFLVAAMFVALGVFLIVLGGLPRRVEERLLRVLRELRQEGREEESRSRQELTQWLGTSLGQAAAGTSESIRGQAAAVTALREGLDRQLTEFREALTGATGREISLLGESLRHSFDLQNQRLEAFQSTLGELTRSNEQKLEAVRSVLERKLAELREDNNAKLEAMRATVEEKLQSTLERRLGESFQVVSQNLEKVHTAMGSMQQLAEGVGDLKKIMSNVTTRGAWGEMQLASILEQFLSPAQYDRNVSPHKRGERVEFAIRLPGRDGEGSCVWLPIDAKFPREDYERLVAAGADTAAAGAALRQLQERIKSSAKEIHDKYLNPPVTTDFAILFLPVEGLYAEVLRLPGLVEELQKDYRVVISGPTTLVALLNSLQMGFRTLAIEKQSSEVWKTLGAVKTEFGKFGETLEKVKDKLHQASSQIDQAGRRSRVMERKLQEVSALPSGEAKALLGEPEEVEALEEVPPA